MARVLIVDDDLNYLNALAEGLTTLNHDVTTATSGAEAMALVQNMPVDIAIFDMLMEGGGAISLLHSIRKNNYDFPVIVATGRTQIAESPIFRNGMREASAKVRKSATLGEIDRLIHSLVAR